jgi:glycosyltransferase involved in cell wall biosynthesis
VPEVLGDAGVLVASRDPYALADAIGTLLADPTRRATMAEAGRRRFAELDLPNAADRFVDLLVEVRAKAAGRRK